MLNKEIKFKITKEILKYYGFYLIDNILQRSYFDISKKVYLRYSRYNNYDLIDLINEDIEYPHIVRTFVITSAKQLSDIISTYKNEKQSLENME